MDDFYDDIQVGMNLYFYLSGSSLLAASGFFEFVECFEKFFKSCIRKKRLWSNQKIQ